VARVLGNLTFVSAQHAVGCRGTLGTVAAQSACSAGEEFVDTPIVHTERRQGRCRQSTTAEAVSPRLFTVLQRSAR